MARVSPTLNASTPDDHTSKVVTTAGVIGALYFGREILIPIALAILLSFALAPAVKLLQKLGLGRVLPVIVSVLSTFIVIAGVGALVASQVRDLSSDLPRYEATMVQKIEAIRSFTNSGGVRKLEDAVAKFTRAVGTSDQSGKLTSAPNSSTSNTSGKAPPPLPVEVVQPDIGPVRTIVMVSAPLVHPLSVAAVVLIFVVFILLQREDLRNRAIRLFGANDLQRATEAINDGGKRLSRYLLAQCALNAAAGVLVSMVLWLIGIPSPILLGLFFAGSRFVPYIGPIIGLLAPLLLATAVDPGWSMVLWTIISILAIEGVIGQVIEPFAYGHNTGLSPIAIVIAATFWTALWGTVGLFLSTPLTVCLVVLGRHVESLAFLDVLLGDRPPLSLSETFYQRMLANDPSEAADQAQRCLGEMSFAQYYDSVALPALIMAQDDAVEGRLDLDRQQRIKETALEVIDDLAAAESADVTGAKELSERTSLFRFAGTKVNDVQQVSIEDLVPERVPEGLKTPGSVLCIGARAPLDDAAAAMLAQVFASYGIGATAESFVRMSKTELSTLDLRPVKLIILSTLDGSSAAFLRFILRRLRRHAPQTEIVVGAWWRHDGYRKADEDIDKAIHEPKVASFLEAVRFCFKPSPSASEQPVLEAPDQLVPDRLSVA